LKFLKNEVKDKINRPLTNSRLDQSSVINRSLTNRPYTQLIQGNCSEELSTPA